jgi:hypothetical protein
MDSTWARLSIQMISCDKLSRFKAEMSEIPEDERQHSVERSVLQLGNPDNEH